MTRKFGVSMDDDLAERIEENLEFGDSRSDRIEELVELGLVLEETAESQHVEIPDNRREREAFIRQLFIDADI